MSLSHNPFQSIHTTELEHSFNQNEHTINLETWWLATMTPKEMYVIGKQSQNRLYRKHCWNQDIDLHSQWRSRENIIAEQTC